MRFCVKTSKKKCFINKHRHETWCFNEPTYNYDPKIITIPSQIIQNYIKIEENSWNFKTKDCSRRLGDSLVHAVNTSQAMSWIPITRVGLATYGFGKEYNVIYECRCSHNKFHGICPTRLIVYVFFETSTIFI